MNVWIVVTSGSTNCWKQITVDPSRLYLVSIRVASILRRPTPLLICPGSYGNETKVHKDGRVGKRVGEGRNRRPWPGQRLTVKSSNKGVRSRALTTGAPNPSSAQIRLPLAGRFPNRRQRSVLPNISSTLFVAVQTAPNSDVVQFHSLDAHNMTRLDPSQPLQSPTASSGDPPALAAAQDTVATDNDDTAATFLASLNIVAEMDPLFTGFASLDERVLNQLGAAAYAGCCVPIVRRRGQASNVEDDSMPYLTADRLVVTAGRRQACAEVMRLLDFIIWHNLILALFSRWYSCSYLS